MNNKFPPKKIWAKPKQAGKKEGGWGEGIFARLPKRSPAAARRSAKKFSLHFLICARPIFSSKRKRKLFCGALL